MTGRIHLNTAGAGLMDPAVVDVITECVRSESQIGAYETEIRYARILAREIYQAVAALTGATPERVALFDSATRAWQSLVDRLEPPRGSRILITPFEYAGNYLSLSALAARHGATVEVLPLDARGDLDLDRLAARLADDVSVVSVPHIPSGCGVVAPVEEIGALLAGRDCLYLVDACQSVGQRPIDVARIRCDLLTGAGRKYLCGPRGTGFAVLSDRMRDAMRPGFRDVHTVDLRPDLGVTVSDDTARREELAERSTAGILGLHAALARRGSVSPAGIEERTTALSEVIAGVPGCELINPGRRQSGLVTFRYAHSEAAAIRDRLSAAGVNVWAIAGSHTPIYMAARGVRTAVRASVHHYTTFAEIESFGRLLATVLR